MSHGCQTFPIADCRLPNGTANTASSEAHRKRSPAYPAWDATLKQALSDRQSELLTKGKKSSPGRRLSHVARLAACLRAAASPPYFLFRGAAKRLSPVIGQDARCDHVARDGGFVIPARAASPRRDFFEFLDGLRDGAILGGTMLMILILSGCQAQRSTSPGLEAAGASAATIDGTLDTIGYHANELRKGIK